MRRGDSIPDFRNVACRLTQISNMSCAVPSPRRALAIVTNAGRDAVDARVSLTNDADGEVVWS
jgi:hypothetical protein